MAKIAANCGFVLGLAIGLMAACGPASADPRDEVLTRAARCNVINDSRVWLDCYYGAAQPMRGQLGLAPAPESQTRLVPEDGGPRTVSAAPGPAAPQAVAGLPPMPQRKSKGILGTLLGGVVVVNKLHASAFSYSPQGYFTVTLQDGEVWRQDQDDAHLTKWPLAPSRYQVTVKEGALDGYNLSVNDEGQLYKVHRIH